MDGRNLETGDYFVDEVINWRAKENPIWRMRPIGANGCHYILFDRAGYIAACLEARRPIVITWVPSIVRLYCRNYQDIYGVPDMFGIEEILTLFTNIKGMERFRIFLIPYLLTGYDIPEELERDEEPLVLFTAKMIGLMREIEGEPVLSDWMRE